MRKSPDLNVMHKTCVFLRNYTKHDIGVAIMGNELFLNDWTDKIVIYREPLDNKGLERFCFKILKLRDAIYQVWIVQSNQVVKDFDKNRSSLEYVKSIFGYIPKLL